MCGIVGAIGFISPKEYVFKGLKMLPRLCNTQNPGGRLQNMTGSTAGLLRLRAWWRSPHMLHIPNLDERRLHSFSPGPGMGSTFHRFLVTTVTISGPEAVT